MVFQLFYHPINEKIISNPIKPIPKSPITNSEDKI